MSIDARQVKDGLKVYVEGLGMSSTHVERMHQDLERRLEEERASRRPARRARDRLRSRASHRRRWVTAAAAVAVAATVAGALWVRHPAPPPPAPATGVDLAHELVGVWHGIGDSRFVTVFHPDGTELSFSDPQGVLHPDLYWIPAGLIGSATRYRVSGDSLVMTSQDGTARPCVFTFTGRSQGQGAIDLSPVDETGAGCVNGALLSPFTIVQISPASPAGLAYRVEPDTTMTPVLAPNALHGTWLLRGTGVLLAIGPTGAAAGVEYLMDHKGTLDSAADDHGVLTVPGTGQVVLHSGNPGCADTVLADTRAGDYSFDATVVADPCHQLPGQNALHWLRIN